MLTCTKTYRDIPFAHRQHCHDGRCALVHGHNWSITLTFGCRETDPNGFVVDFGKLRFLKEWIDAHLDHACLFNESDAEGRALRESAPRLFKSYVLPDCSSEGIASHLHAVWDPMVRERTGGRAWITQIAVGEDSKNAAAYRPD